MGPVAASFQHVWTKLGIFIRIHSVLLLGLQLCGQFAIGIALAIGHHCYYRSLDGQLSSSEPQQWVIRYGTGFAFLVNVFLSASASAAYLQCVWALLRVKHHSIGAVDAMMAAEYRLLSLVKTELYESKRHVLLLAILWSLPLSAIVTPASISVVEHTEMTSSKCEVPSIDFSTPVRGANAVQGATLLRDPDYPVDGSNDINTVDVSFFHWGANSLAHRIVEGTVYSGRMTPWDSPCGPNCTYELEFHGPVQKCEEVKLSEGPWESTSLDINRTDPEPQSHLQYQSERGGLPISALDNETTSLTWFNYKYLPLEHRILDSYGYLDVQNIQESLWEKHVFRCNDYNATYKVTVTFQNSQLVVAPEVTYRNPAPYASELVWGYSDSIVVHYAISEVFQALVTGYLASGTRGYGAKDYTKISSTLLFERNVVANSHAAHYPSRSLKRGVETLSQNITLSMISERSLAFSSTQSTVCTMSQTSIIFHYSWLSLLLPYGCAILATGISLGFGLWHLHANNFAGAIDFTTIALATRNPVLNQDLVQWIDEDNFDSHTIKNHQIRFESSLIVRKSNDPPERLPDEHETSVIVSGKDLILNQVFAMRETQTQSRLGESKDDQRESPLLLSRFEARE